MGQVKSGIFVDASVWIGYIAINDAHHSAAKEKLNQLLLDPEIVLYTSDYVLDETFTRLKRKAPLKTVLPFNQEIANMKTKRKLKILFINKKIFNRAFKIFTDKSLPKTFSFTDAVIATQMKVHKLDALFTFDRDFKKLRKPRLKIIPGGKGV